MPEKPRPVLIYPANATEKLDPELFRNPTAVYRGAPFWAWNAKVDLPQLFRQIDLLKQMGFGGFMIHSRTGLDTEYLGKDYVDAVVACSERAAELSMLSWLYDEDRWPSGFAGGIVTRDPQCRTRQLLWTATAYCGKIGAGAAQGTLSTGRTENGTLLARYDVELDDRGFLAKYRRLAENDKPSKRGRVWYAYLETTPETSWFNNQTYVDTFSVAAIEGFIEVTHERFKRVLWHHFGGAIPAIFSDEPQFVKKTMFATAREERDLIMPFSPDFAETFRATYKQDLLDHLPELFWNLPDDKPSLVRYRYHDHTAERFAKAFGDTIGAWCERNNLALTGHMLAEVNLHGQTRGVGEVMRALRAFHIPGIDMLCDRREFTTAKQSQSIAHQYDRPGVLSELYGVTNWDFDFVGHKAQGDWQAAMGVTVRVPHLSWVSMSGEAKRDYPASISYQSPWYTEYPLIEDHFARVNTVLSRGRPLVRVAVIHPIESFWLCWGPTEHNQPEIEQREDHFRALPEWLAYGLIDFDYVSEALLPTLSPSPRTRGEGRGEGSFRVGAMRYDAVVVPAMRTIRSTTLDRLTTFVKAGGTVIFAGEVPSLVDARPSSAAQKLAKLCTCVAMEKRPLLEALEPLREVEIRHADGSPADSIIHQIRIDGKHRHLFLCNMDRQRPRPEARVRIRGRWDATLLDTFTGDIHPLACEMRGASTIITQSFAAHGHLLVSLAPARNKTKSHAHVVVEDRWHEIGRLTDPVLITLSEPNVLLLDQAEWRLDDGRWQPREEVLRLDNQVRKQLGLPLREGRIAQPWSDTSPSPVVARLQLRFELNSDADVRAATLAVEEAEQLEIEFDGQRVPNHITGWWVDESIKTVALPGFSAGGHQLRLTIPFTRRSNVEWCYLLGDFGVDVAGRNARVTAPIRSLSWADWTHRGLPFYAGNVTYHCPLDGDGSRTLIEVPKFKNPLLSVNLDGKPAGKIAFAPFQLDLSKLDTGRHKLDITAYGNRVNAFGPLHHTNEHLEWIGPGAWRSQGTAWSYEYNLKRMGILTAPIVLASARS